MAKTATVQELFNLCKQQYMAKCEERGVPLCVVMQDKFTLWRTDVWMRQAENTDPDKGKSSCKHCKGTGEAHFCAVPGNKCTNLNKLTDCPHPTEEEFQKLIEIQNETDKRIAELARTCFDETWEQFLLAGNTLFPTEMAPFLDDLKDKLQWRESLLT